ncbi:MAG: hypothetical protein NE330_09570, partial [Lentisphaeraceae bacterium]|nr:hypothetical protein [Lentisphaeraceae bacterium]
LEVFAGTSGSAVNDLTGDGKSDLVWRHGISGKTYLWEMDGGEQLSISSLGTVTLDWRQIFEE